MYLVHLSNGDDFGVYESGRRDPKTGLKVLFRGALKACLKFRKED
jgi:hypothetical protein